jgi:hypothetical protein
VALSGTCCASPDIGPALTDLKAAGWNPNVIVMNPRDWFAIESERANDGDGKYVIGTPRDPAPPSLWGTPWLSRWGCRSSVR